MPASVACKSRLPSAWAPRSFRARRNRAVVQLGRTLEWGSRGREFESRRPDQRAPSQKEGLCGLRSFQGKSAGIPSVYPVRCGRNENRRTPEEGRHSRIARQCRSNSPPAPRQRGVLRTEKSGGKVKDRALETSGRRTAHGKLKECLHSLESVDRQNAGWNLETLLQNLAAMRANNAPSTKIGEEGRMNLETALRVESCLPAICAASAIHPAEECSFRRKPLSFFLSIAPPTSAPALPSVLNHHLSTPFLG